MSPSTKRQNAVTFFASFVLGLLVCACATAPDTPPQSVLSRSRVREAGLESQKQLRLLEAWEGWPQGTLLQVQSVSSTEEQSYVLRLPSESGQTSQSEWIVERSLVHRVAFTAADAQRLPAQKQPTEWLCHERFRQGERTQTPLSLDFSCPARYSAP